VLEMKVLRLNRATETLLAGLENREVALWLRDLPQDAPDRVAVSEFMRLPWKLVLSEAYGVDFFNALEADAAIDDPETRKRGFIHLIDSDPSKIDLPQRCLPIYLLNGRHYERQTNFEGQLRRMTMLETLRQSGVRQVVIVSFRAEPIPADLKELWASDFKSKPEAPTGSSWQAFAYGLPVTLPPSAVGERLASRYSMTGNSAQRPQRRR
jgi:hypothetical protein